MFKKKKFKFLVPLFATRAFIQVAIFPELWGNVYMLWWFVSVAYKLIWNVGIRKR